MKWVFLRAQSCFLHCIFTYGFLLDVIHAENLRESTYFLPILIFPDSTITFFKNIDYWP